MSPGEHRHRFHFQYTHARVNMYTYICAPTRRTFRPALSRVTAVLPRNYFFKPPTPPARSVQCNVSIQYRRSCFIRPRRSALLAQDMQGSSKNTIVISRKRSRRLPERRRNKKNVLHRGERSSILRVNAYYPRHERFPKTVSPTKETGKVARKSSRFYRASIAHKWCFAGRPSGRFSVD